jgi:hypothetical protein
VMRAFLAPAFDETSTGLPFPATVYAISNASRGDEYPCSVLWTGAIVLGDATGVQKMSKSDSPHG